MPGDEVEFKIVCGGGFKETTYPVGIEAGGGRSTEFERVGDFGGGGSLSSCFVKGEVITVTRGFPVAKKVRFVPNFVVKVRKVLAVLESSGVVLNGFLDNIGPVGPIIGGGSDVVLRKSWGHI